MKKVVCKVCHNKYAEEDHDYNELQNFAAFVLRIVAPTQEVTHDAWKQMFLNWKKQYSNAKTITY